MGKIIKKLIRRVNPWRGNTIAYDLPLSQERLEFFESFLPEGDIEKQKIFHLVPPYLSLRTCAEKRIFPQLPTWELVFVLFGAEYALQYPLGFDEVKLLSMQALDPILSNCEGLSPELGSGVNKPCEGWAWKKGDKKIILKEEFFPLSEEVAQVCLASVEDVFLYSPLDLSDNYELWILDKDARHPIALVSTAESLDEICYRPFSPIEWFFSGEKEAHPSLLDLEEQIDGITCSVNSEDKEGFYLIVVEKNKYAHFEYLVDRDTGSYEVRRAENLYPQTFLCDRFLQEYQEIVGATNE